MTILYFLIGCSIVLALFFLAAFFWAMRTGQNDDMQTPAMRILFDEDMPEDENPRK
ncbi:MAG: cbb3-type cytochrome oxidase assembly protein CcoS [Sphingobacteriaceae bacterium]